MKGTSNWTFREVVAFLKRNGFKEIKIDGSHHIFSGIVHGQPVMVEVQNHANVNGMIKTGTLRDGIIVQSRIPVSEWRAYAKLPAQKRKKYIYEGCKSTTKV